MKFNAIILIICMSLQSCSLTLNHIGERAPSSEANVEEFVSKMKNFKVRVMGTEEDSKCTQEEQDKEFNKLVASVKIDSCSVDKFKLDREEFNERKCPKIRVEGYFDKVVRQIFKEEKNKKNISLFQQKADAEFVAFNKEAQEFFKVLMLTIQDAGVAHEDRAKLVAEYVENVVLPIRDIVVIMRSYLPKEDDGRIFYESLLPEFNSEFARGLSKEDLELVTQGPTPTSPFYMNILQQRNGNYRLSFVETDIIRRDVLTLLKAPTSKNYVIALKWMTLHMMLSQINLYDTILGNKADLSIPNSCQNHFNGNMPSKLRFDFEDGIGDFILDKMLIKHGLTADKEDSTYFDYYLENVNKDPSKEGYSGLAPFENYRSALRSSETSTPQALEPQFDDRAHFQTILSSKLSEAQSVFKGRVKGQNVTYAGYETFQKMLGEFTDKDIAEIKLKNGETTQIYSGLQNLSPYLLEVMQANGLIDYSDLITDKLKSKFKGKISLIDFPSLYSSPVWRDWSLKLLADKMYEQSGASKSSPVYKTVLNACQMNTRRNPDLTKICNGHVLLNLSDFLAEFRSGEKYIPTRRLEEARYKELYPFLGYIWINMRDNLNLLPEARPGELEFLMDQMAAMNPWARLKFSYMIALDQLEHQEEGIIPQYNQKNHFSKSNDEVMCRINNVAIEYNSISRAGKVLGLDKTFSYNHAGKFLSRKDKDTIWKKILDDVNKQNHQLFSVKTKNQNYYQMLEDISTKTILNEKSALNTGVALSNKATNEVKLISQITQAKLSDFFLSLYQEKDSKKQQELFEQFTKVNGIDNDFNVKLNFLAMDDAYKQPIYRDVIRRATQTRKMQILTQLDKFCNMSVNDEVQFKDIFYQTTKTQNDLNQMAGLPSVPPDVMEKLGAMTSSEWRDMWLNVGGMAAMLVGGACMAATGGICAPLGGAIAVAGLGALGIQVKLTTNELDRKKEADRSESQVKMMEDLGFANTGSADEVSRSYAWTAFEAISIFPLVGIATRSLTMGSKFAYVSAQTIMRKSGKTSFKALSQAFKQQEDVRAAYYLLDFTNISKNAGVDTKTLEKAKDKIARIKKLYTSGQISSDTMIKRIGEVLDPIKRAKLAMAKTVKNELGSITIKESKEQIDKQTAVMVSNYFGDNPKELLRLIQGYSGERLDRAVKAMDRMNSIDRIGGVPIYSNVKDWFLKLRNEDLAKNASKILRIEDELKILVNSGAQKGQLENFVNKNIEDLTDIFIDIPFKKREIPHFIFVQGMPDFNFYKGRKIPFLSTMSEGQSMRRFFTARARLVHETYKSQARNTLKLKRFTQSETTYEVFRAFKLSVAEMASRKSAPEARKILGEYRAMEEQVIRKLHSKYKLSDKERMEFKKFKTLILEPKTLKDKATAEAIWASVPADELMKMKEVGAYAHKAVQELSKYSDVDSFERYLQALKILTINRNPAVLEIM